MAVYTAFVSSPHVNFPIQVEENGPWLPYVTADVIMLDSTGTVVPPYGMGDQWAGAATIQATGPLLVSDTTNSVHAKIAAAIRLNWAPTVVASDIVRVVPLDSGALINL